MAKHGEETEPWPQQRDAGLDELLRALAHPARRRILTLANAESVSAGSLARALQLANATTSEHLKVLRKTGLVAMTAEGTWRWYRTNRELLARASDAIAAFVRSIQQRKDTTMKIVHFDVAGPDEAALHRFYTGVLGWQVEPQGPGYALVHTPADSPDGAVVDAAEPSLTLGVSVADLESTVARVQELGGEVLMEPTDNGWVTKAVVTDPAGNRLSLIAS